jgi:hypothetical protein
MATKNKETKTNVPALPEIPSDASPSTKIWMAAVKEALEVRLGRRGDKRDRAVTLRELIESGLAKALKDNPFNTAITDLDFIPFYDDPGELDVPPTPANLQASGGFTKIVLSWTAGWTLYSNHKHAEIWRHTSDALGDALLIGTTQAGLFTDTVDMGSTFYYWVRNVSKTDVFSGYAGEVHASTSEDVGAIMTSLSETLSGLPGYSLLQTAAAAIEIIQASGAPDGNTNRADGSDPHAGDIYVNTANSQQYVRNAANNAWIRAVDATLTTTVSSQASSINTNASAISTANGNISTLTTASGAHTTSINSLNSSVAVKARVYRQSSEPSGGSYVAGDLWVDTDDKQLYQWNGSAWVSARDVGLATATSLSTVSSSVTTAQSAANTAQSTANSKTTTFRQNATPTAITVGDIWIDLDDGNKMYVATATGTGGWSETTNAQIAVAQSTANSKTTTFRQNGTPTAVTVGDVWIDTDDGNKMYIATATGTGGWSEATDAQIAVAQSAANAAQSTANSKTQTFRQNGTPTAITVGDIWVDLDDGNKMYVATATGTGGWSETTNAQIAAAQSTANSKTTTFRQNGTPTAITVGDVWIDTDDGNKMYIATGTGTGSWSEATDGQIAVAQSAANAANALAATKITTFRQASIPTSLAAGDIWIDIDDGNKMYIAQAIGSDAINANEWVDRVDSRITTATASISTLQTTTATLTGDAAAAYVLNVNANGSVAGMVIEANASSSGDNVGSAVQFMADKFAIWNGTGNTSSGSAVAPFIVDSGVVYIDMARIKDGAIQTAKIGAAQIDTARVADAAIVTAKIGDLEVTTAKINNASITEAKIGSAAITTAKIANAAITNAKITSLYANTLNGDVSKSVAGTLASTVTFENRSSAFNHVLTLSLPKPTHTTGWTPYANFNVNKMGTDKNSWYWLIIEMAVWNVNSVGTTATETATSNTNISAFGTGFAGAAVVSNYMGPITPSITTVSNAHVITVSPTVFYTPGTTTIDSALIPDTSDYIMDSTGKVRQINAIAAPDGEFITNYILSYSGTQDLATSGGHWFQESIASNATGRYNVVAAIEWIAVDTAYNDFSISGVWADPSAVQTVGHGVKARLRVAGDSASNNGEQASGNQYLHTATGLLMGIR